jgi:hypothetical protein
MPLLSAGTKLGHYEVLSLLGTGGKYAKLDKSRSYTGFEI